MKTSRPVDELGDEGRAAWSDRVAKLVESAAGELEGKTHLTSELDDAAGVAVLDWTGLPERIVSCLTRGDALELLDGPGDIGGRALQEEYLEWRVVRERGRIARVELTTELPDYWCVLAAYEPERTLALVAAFSGERAVPAGEVYGSLDPLARGVTPAERERAFRECMLGSTPSARNRRGICCMVQKSNSLESLVTLAAAATTPRVLRDLAGGHLRCLTCTEAFPFLGEAAMPARASDPLLVERLARLAFEGRRVAFDGAPGVYIQAVEHARLAAPGGRPVPREWFRFEREQVDGYAKPRYQRIVFEVPRDARFGVDDIVDLATEQPLRYGGQIADLVQIAIFLRVTEPGVLAVPEEPVGLKQAVEDAGSCRDIRARHERFAARRRRH